jgi:hypothetical protein
MDDVSYTADALAKRGEMLQHGAPSEKPPWAPASPEPVDARKLLSEINLEINWPAINTPIKALKLAKRMQLLDQQLAKLVVSDELAIVRDGYRKKAHGILENAQDRALDLTRV